MTLKRTNPIKVSDVEGLVRFWKDSSEWLKIGRGLSALVVETTCTCDSLRKVDERCKAADGEHMCQIRRLV